MRWMVPCPDCGCPSLPVRGGRAGSRWVDCPACGSSKAVYIPAPPDTVPAMAGPREEPVPGTRRLLIGPDGRGTTVPGILARFSTTGRYAFDWIDVLPVKASRGFAPVLFRSVGSSYPPYGCISYSDVWIDVPASDLPAKNLDPDHLPGMSTHVKYKQVDIDIVHGDFKARSFGALESALRHVVMYHATTWHGIHDQEGKT